MKQQDRLDRVMLLIAGGLVSATVAVVVWGRCTRGPTQSGSSPLTQATRVDGGTPIQRGRIDDYTARVAQEDTYEALVEGLNAYEGLLVGVSALSQELVTEQMFEICLANRRLARLLEILKTRDDADAACRELFAEKLAILRQSSLEVLDRLNANGGPRIAEFPLKEPITGPDDHRALSAALFLSTEFCPVEEVVRQLDAWMDSGEDLRERYKTQSADWEPSNLIEGSKASFLLEVFPQSRFQLSLLSSMLYRRFGIDPGGTAWDNHEERARIRSLGRWDRFDPDGRVPNWMGYRLIPLCAWDAVTNPFDFTHVHRGVPVDQRETFGDFVVFSSWGLAAGDEEMKQRILDDLRTRLTAAAAAEEGNSN